MISETSKNSQNQALEERLSNMHEQMAGVTSRLDQTERDLDLERAAREEIFKKEDAKGSRISELRDELARPLWEMFHLWCLNEILNYDQNSQMYKALNYVIRHYEELTAYLDIPEMPLDNNDTEREIRAMVMGKKAYLFCQTDDACERAAMMYSFFGACKVKGKNPERWLTYVLDHIKETKDEDMYKLLPEFWEDIN
jgi:protein subunit release factor A